MRPALRCLGLALVAVASPVRAGGEGGECAPGRLVSTGDTMAYVYTHCGPPASASTSFHTWRNTQTRVDQWVYSLGEGTFPRLLYFQNGILTSYGEGDR
jgi:hypothetical protein